MDYGGKEIRCETGFTLLEVVIAMAVFSVGIMSVASMQIISIRNSAVAVEYTEATQWASNQAELIMATPYAALASGGPVLSADNRFAANWTVDAEVNGMRRIVVTVTWTEFGRARNISYAFIKSRDV